MRRRITRFGPDQHQLPTQAADSDGSLAMAGLPVETNSNLVWIRNLLEALAEGIVIVDEDGVIQFTNQRAELIFGWGKDELVGQKVDVLVPLDLKQFQQKHLGGSFRKSVLNPPGTGRRLPGCRKDGRGVHVEIVLSPFSTESGTWIFCLITDVSARVATDARLKENDIRFETLFRAFPIPTYVWQRQEHDFVLIDFNDAARGYTSSTIRNYLKRGLRAMYPEGREVVEAIEQCYREKSRFTRQMHGYRLRSTGESKDLVVTYLFVEPDLVLAIIDDVTAERAALGDVMKLSSAVEQTEDAIFITDKSGVIEYVNPGFEMITGYGREEAVGNTPRLLKSGQMPPGYYQHLWQTVLSGAAFRAQTVNRRRDGTLFVAEQTITPMKDGTGQITHFVSVLKDMTERIRLHEQETEHRLAGMVQKQLFPVQSPQIAGYDIAGAVFSALDTSGDYFDYLTMLDNTAGLIVADACGHGMGPALIMAEVRAYLRSIVGHQLAPRSVLDELNTRIYPDLFEDANFITAFLARLDPENHVLEYANAGNWPAYVLDRQGRVRHELRTGGVPIGVLPELALRQTQPIPLAAGSLAVFLTDGIPEAVDPAGQEFGIQRMLAVIRRYRTAPAREIIEHVREAVLSFSGSAEQFDDQTIIICKRLG